VSTYYEEVEQGMASYGRRFNQLVDILVDNWNTEISKQAFERGSMFDRSEYPDVSEIRSKFSFDFNVRPMPLAGDFRLDVGNEALQKLQDMYNAEIQRCVNRAMADAWDRLRQHVEWIRERCAAVLQHGGEGKKPKLYESMIDNGVELCEILRTLNITNDPALEEARTQLHKALLSTDIDSLRESKEVQEKLKNAADSIADKFDW
jgi:hypothetical protein